MGARFGGRPGDCPETESVSDRLVRLPFYNDLTEAEQEENDTPDTDDLVLAEIAGSGPQPNVSFFAFTATPKNKTLELFGTLQDGQRVPFDEYTMRQAIAENFILDVLGAYTTYKRYYKLTTRTAIEDKEYETGPTVRLLSQYVDLQDHAPDAEDHTRGRS